MQRKQYDEMPSPSPSSNCNNQFYFLKTTLVLNVSSIFLQKKTIQKPTCLCITYPSINNTVLDTGNLLGEQILGAHLTHTHTNGNHVRR